jgi:hypothetical protein
MKERATPAEQRPAGNTSGRFMTACDPCRTGNLSQKNTQTSCPRSIAGMTPKLRVSPKGEITKRTHRKKLTIALCGLYETAVSGIFWTTKRTHQAIRLRQTMAERRGNLRLPTDDLKAAIVQLNPTQSNLVAPLTMKTEIEDEGENEDDFQFFYGGFGIYPTESDLIRPFNFYRTLKSYRSHDHIK